VCSAAKLEGRGYRALRQPRQKMDTDFRQEVERQAALAVKLKRRIDNVRARSVVLSACLTWRTGGDCAGSHHGAQRGRALRSESAAAAERAAAHTDL
jgi:hypothetical protein